MQGHAVPGNCAHVQKILEELQRAFDVALLPTIGAGV